jgi:hypothetical protein
VKPPEPLRAYRARPIPWLVAGLSLAAFLAGLDGSRRWRRPWR